MAAWFAGLFQFWLDALLWLVGLSIVFAGLARISPCNPGMRWWSNLRSAATDCVYWFCMPIVFRVARAMLLVAGIALCFGDQPPGLLPLSRWPLWTQCLAVLVLEDAIGYILHRWFHGRAGWRFHAIHHAPTELDWTATARFHPVNSLIEFALPDVLMVLLGFSPAAIVALAPFNALYSALVHANLNWTFGPLRYVIASPVFHRWHHTKQLEGRDKNFASTFPLWDLLGGTFFLPRGELPQTYGIDDAHFPQRVWSQMLYPFCRRPTPQELGVAVRPLAAPLRRAG